MTISVVNKSTMGERPEGTVRFYVGRPALLGNPFRIGEHGDRDEVIEQHRVWFEENADREPFSRAINRLIEVAQDHDIELVCWCSPEPCHAETIAEYVRTRMEQ